MTRRGLLASAAAVAAACCTPPAALAARGPGVRRLARGVPYGDDPRQRMEVLGPTGASKGPRPVLVFFRGGGPESGERGLYGRAAQALAARGFVVVMPDYRRVPTVSFPGFIGDAAAAAARAGALAAAWGGDPARLGVIGHSAGAHLALMIALDRRYMAAAGAPGLIRAAAGLAGPCGVPPCDAPALGRAPDLTLTQPVAFVRPDAPPLWLGHGAQDAVVHAGDSLDLCERMRAVGGRCEAKLYPGLDHAGLIAAVSPPSGGKAPVLDEVAAFLLRALD